MRMRPKRNRLLRLERVSELFALDVEGNFAGSPVTEVTVAEAVDGESEAYVALKPIAIDVEKSFDRKAPLFLEIGCGKGSFACAYAKRRPDVNYLALEKVDDVILLAMERAQREGATNLRFCKADAENLLELLHGIKVDAMFINFCDPWPKARNAKRRLTSPGFLENYKGILADGAKIFFKTDNRPLFDYSLETFAECGYHLENVCFDLHASPLDATNIRTEYETTFSAKGFKINYLEASLKK